MLTYKASQKSLQDEVDRVLTERKKLIDRFNGLGTTWYIDECEGLNFELFNNILTPSISNSKGLVIVGTPEQAVKDSLIYGTGYYLDEK